MQRLTPSAMRSVGELAHRFGTSEHAIETALTAVVGGQGRMAQFSDGELGGSVQWMRGGMTALSDRRDPSLEDRVRTLCEALARLYESQIIYETVSDGAPKPDDGDTKPDDTGRPSWSVGMSTADSQLSWHPAELGTPSASGGQNGMHYAVFPEKRRLAVDCVGRVDVYDTLDHHIEGVSQEQGGDALDLSFTSQHGTFRVDSLPKVDAAR